MVEEAASVSEASVTEVVQTLTEPAVQTLEPNQASIEATVGSAVQGGTESTDANNNNAADSAATDVCDEEREKTLEFADELTEKGSVFLKENDFAEAVDCFSRALEIRVAHYGELDDECINAYYRYGSALFEKAQAEADPLGIVPKKEGEGSSNKDASLKNTANGESLAASLVSSNPAERQGSSSGQQAMDGFSKEEMDLLWEAVEPIVAARESDYHTSLRLDEEIKQKRVELEKLNDALQESESKRKRLHNRIAELKGNIRVFCRVRPLSPDNEEGSPAIDFPTSLEYRGRTLVLKPQNGKRFTFDQVFNPEASQKEVYDEISQLVQSALDGYKVCIFAYGQTGSGKSYTMIGSLHEKAERGLIPRSVEQIFEATESLVAQGWKYNIQVSMFEIYNETIRDLLSTETGSFSCIDVSSIAHVTSLFKQAARRRATGMTQMNETSSRSHFIFQIRLLGDNERSGEHVDGALNLIDLAGSGRVKKSGVAGDRLKETQAINTSLFYLSQVITALIKKQPVVPYTGSKLTLTESLKDCLAAADAKMLMFVNVSPDSSSAAETSNSLEFAETVNACRIGRHKK